MAMKFTAQDTNMIKGVMFKLALPYAGAGGGREIEFQFPPKIVSDGRKGAWEEGELRGTEPIAVFKTSGAREISIKWTYIVTGGSGSNNTMGTSSWSAERVSNNVKKLRGYFAQLKGQSYQGITATSGAGAGFGGGGGRGSRDALIIDFRMWRHGDPYKSMTARIKQIDVKHGETIVTDNPAARTRVRQSGGGFGPPSGLGWNTIFPLRTDITVDLRLWSKSKAGQRGTYQDLGRLRDVTPPLWY
jgi:hypothetical protein